MEGGERIVRAGILQRIRCILCGMLDLCPDKGGRTRTQLSLLRSLHGETQWRVARASRQLFLPYHFEYLPSSE